MTQFPGNTVSERRRKEIASLKRPKHRDRQEAFIVEGTRSVRAALSAGAEILELLIAPSLGDPSICEEAERAGVEVLSISDRDLSSISDVNASQGVLLVARRKQTPADRVLSRSSVLILDGIQDPGNVGTLIRTAAWFGVEAVLSGPDTADFYNPKVVRASMGGIWDVDLATTGDLPSWIISYRETGARIYAADLSGESVHGWHPTHPSAMVIGSEAHGITGVIRQVVDAMVSIPGTGSKRATESLNAAIAGGVIISAWTDGAR